ncbi:AraC family transcriptional regulator [Plesiocystis pacifica]|uniref:AraC family transcriptional regulator n=1 Tax=Plesiocystis pacifica TaxID=191768 RepID=UPI0005D46C9D|nr:AraC family transcriptional regulator [Plesiocystis pacifica]
MHARPGLIEVGHMHVAELAWHAPLSHTDHSATLIVAGSLEMTVGETVSAGPNAVLVVPAGVPHEPVRGHDLELWGVRFCASCFDLDESHPLMTPYARVRRGALPLVSLSEARRDRVVQLYEDMAREQDAGLPESPELLRSMLLLLLAEFYRATPAGPSKWRASSFVPEALSFIQRRALEAISLRDVASAVGRAPTHVAATVKRETGHTVGEWITAAKLAEASSRLLHTDDPIADIAASVGWRDQTHFIRQFRKAHDETPAAWRRRHRRGHQGSGDERGG